ncbi:MAG: glycosyltransferase, partial [Bacteroidales bacterium]|nr:glycosyltransferase [Bacteroidales bacterium]
MINILYITSGLHRGGAERQLLNLLSGLDKSRFKPILVIMCRHGERLQEALELGIDIRFIIRRWRWDILLFREFVRIIRNERIPIVHTWGMMPA